MTSEFSDRALVKQVLLSREDFHPFPKYDERAAWDALPQETKDVYLSQKEELLGYEPTALTAALYMGAYRTGSSAEFSKTLCERREKLLSCVLCECIEHRGELMDKIIDLVWAACEESSWITPTHNNHMHNHMLTGIMKNALPDVTDFCFIDLHAGGTAGFLAWIYYLLKEPLDRETPMVCERIELELLKRIVIPFLNHDDMTWCGFYGHKINNWNPFIINNILAVSLICVKDPDLRVKVFAKALEKLDIYIRVIPSDGGCDEGPGYWDMAGGALYDCFSMIYAGTGGKLNFFTQPLVKKAAEYIAKANLSGGMFANFADNSPHTRMNPKMLYRYALAVDSQRLIRFASAVTEKFQPAYDWYLNFSRGMQDFFCTPPLPAPEPETQTDCDFLPETQILYARDRQNRVQLAAKGGFNNESHNHNDLGSFILLRDGKPVIVDLGSLPYTTKTFSPLRYEIWILTSAWHSCATVAGYDQHAGDDYRAKLLTYEEQGSTVAFSLELKDAYEKEAGILSYQRTFRFCRDTGAVSVQDHMELSREAEAEIHFITAAKPELLPGAVQIPAGDGFCRMEYAPEGLSAAVDAHDLECEGLKREWNSDACYRISLRSAAGRTHHFEVHIG